MLLQSVPNQPETIQNAGNNQPQRIPRGLYHDIMPEPIGAAMHHISPNSRNRPPNRADQISPNRSRQTGAACHGQPGRIFRGSPVRGVCSRFAVPLFVMPRKCFLRIFRPNCTKLLLCAITKTRKTAHLLAFCKHAGFLTNFARLFLTDFCVLYGL